MKPRIKKLSAGTYRVTFTKTQVYVVVIPAFWVELGNESMCRSVAVETASELLPRA